MREKSIQKCELLPLERISHFVLQVAGEALERAYNLQAVNMDPIPLPKHAYKKPRHQYNATALVKYVKKKKKLNYALGLIENDLYSQNLNFVFGQAIPGIAAVLSIHRLHSDNRELFKERVEKEVIHEIGHVLGLDHCESSKCVMAFSNSLRQVDSKKEDLCQKCRERLPLFLKKES